MRQLIVAIMVLMITSSQSWAMEIFKSRQNAGISIQVNSPHIKNFRVTKDSKYFYVYGDVVKPFGRTFNYGDKITVSLIDSNGKEIENGSGRISYTPGSRGARQRQRDGSFFIKLKFTPEVDQCLIKSNLS